MIKGVIFDVDGVLLNSMPVWENLGELYLDHLGIEAEKNLGETLFEMSLEEAADYLKILVQAGYNIFISGATSTGKTTFLNVLADYIPKTERVITIEDSAELQLHDIANLVRMEVRQADAEGVSSVTLRDLIKASLRMRPDRIIVGEVRGPEALDMIQSIICTI